MTLFQSGDFELHSKGRSNFKIDCDSFSWGDIVALADQLNQFLPRYGAVYPIPKGGCRLAAALKKYTTEEHKNVLLIVDDVLTTGNSMREALHRVSDDWEQVYGTVIFSRGKCPKWIFPLFQMRYHAE
jgi:hypothetical protein